MKEILLVLDNFNDLDIKKWERLERKLADLSKVQSGLKIILSYTKYKPKYKFKNFLKNST